MAAAIPRIGISGVVYTGIFWYIPYHEYILVYAAAVLYYNDTTGFHVRITAAARAWLIISFTVHVSPR